MSDKSRTVIANDRKDERNAHDLSSARELRIVPPASIAAEQDSKDASGKHRSGGEYSVSTDAIALRV